MNSGSQLTFHRGIATGESYSFLNLITGLRWVVMQKLQYLSICIHNSIGSIFNYKRPYYAIR